MPNETAFTQADNQYMLRAIALAERGAGAVDPNPLVGAVVVKDGAIIGEGWHERYAQPHAERNALADCRARGNDPRGATIYVTLEPCSHHGKQPPCADALIEAGIARVVCGMGDPNPLVAGAGIERLRAAGAEVSVGLLEEKCIAQNRIFLYNITTKKPFVSLKFAMTLDGKIATKTGESQWISGEESRAHAHELRARHTAIMVGIGTVLADDPSLTCRPSADFCGVARNPLRVICDSRLRIPLDSRLVALAHDGKTLVATASEDAEKRAALEERGVCVLRVPSADGRVDLAALVSELRARGINGILTEGGGELSYSMLSARLVNRIYAYIAPTLFGGSAKAPVGGEGVCHIADAFHGRFDGVTRLGADTLLECEII